MIETLLIKNFQPYKSNGIVLHPGVNVIIGDSDSGKTSILRALRWVIENRAPGDFVSHFSKEKDETSVEAVVGGVRVIRAVKGKDNVYSINKKVLTAFGKQVPAEVSDVFNMSELNTQFQHDAPFLLSASSGEVARVLNRVANLDKIDSSLKFIASKKRVISGDLKHAEDDLAAVDAELATFIDLDAVEKRVARIEALQQQLDDTERSYNALLLVIERLEAAEKARKSLKDPTEAEKKLKLVAVLCEKHEAQEQEAEDIAEILKLIKQYEHANIEDAKTLAAAEKEYAKYMLKACPLCGRKGE